METDKNNLGKFKTVSPVIFNTILSMITNRENVSILMEVSRSFAKVIENNLRKDNSLVQCLKDMRSLIKSLEEFKFLINNHCTQLEGNLKKFKDSYSPFIFNKAIYLLSSYLFKDLQIFDVQKNNIGTDGIILLTPLIKKTSSLIHLNLAYNNIGDEGCKFLALPLKKNNSMQNLNLECNCISDIGLIFLSDPIVESKTLKTVKFALNSVTFEGVKLLATLFEKLTNQISVIDFKYNNLVVRDDFHADYFRKYKIIF